MLERFIADCRDAHAADSSHKAVREVVARTVADPGSVLRWLGEPKRAEVETLLSSASIPGARTTSSGAGGRAPGAARSKQRVRKRCASVIHSVTNPIRRLTGAIHVYGGDFFGARAQRMEPGNFEQANRANS